MSLRLLSAWIGGLLVFAGVAFVGPLAFILGADYYNGRLLALACFVLGASILYVRARGR